MNDYEQLVDHIGRIVDYHSFLSYLGVLEEKGRITLYAGTYSLRDAVKMDDIEGAKFYFYYNDSKSGFCFYINKMGAALEKDDDLFTWAHRRLYSKNHLSNCFFGEKDLRCGEYFQK